MAGRWNLFDDSGTEGSKSTWGGLHSSSRRGFNGVIPFLPNVPWFWDVLIVSSQDMCGKIGEILHKYPKLSGICFPLSIVWWCFVHRARYHPGGWRYLDGHHVLSCSQGEMHRPPKLHRFLFGGLAIRGRWTRWTRWRCSSWGWNEVDSNAHGSMMFNDVQCL